MSNLEEIKVKEYVILAAKESKGKASLWFRYLNKMLSSDKENEYRKILTSSESLDAFQKTIVKIIFSDNNWLLFVKGLNKKADSQWIRRKYGL